jgi:aspartyl-tRNA(Asn)/glutamyl-tRNA(Gln) amidotransferase subunit A
MIDLKTITIEKAQAMMNAGETTALEIVNLYLAEIEKNNKDVNAYLEVFTDVVENAKLADDERQAVKSAGPEKLNELLKNKPLLGIPMSIKDNILIKGKIASASSKILEKYVAPYDATVITKLKNAGAIFIGRTNMDEFAMGGSTENSAYGITKNPIDNSRVAGGSSGGSAASIAMYGAMASLGSDTGGSIRQPASYCGVVGLKPTYGSVSRHGLMAMGSSLDVIGPITKNIADTETIFNVIRGGDINNIYDSTNISGGLSKNEENLNKNKNPSEITVGILPDLFNMGGIDASVLQNLRDSIEKIKNAGFKVKEISLPRLKYSLAVYYVVMPAEVSSNMARFDGVKFGGKISGNGGLLSDYLETRGKLLGKEVRRRIILGTYVLSSGYHDAYYNKANAVRDLLRSDFKQVFESVDVILTPTAPSPAFKIGQNTDDPIKMYLEDIFTVPANLVGIPAISIPSGSAEIDGKQIPLGVQLMSPHGREDLLFGVGRVFEGK